MVPAALDAMALLLRGIFKLGDGWRELSDRWWELGDGLRVNEAMFKGTRRQRGGPRDTARGETGETKLR